MVDDFSLKGKSIFITGASSGIGACTAVACSKLGASLIISGRNQERLQATFDDLEGEGHTMIPADLDNDDQIAKIIEELPSIDGLVLCAGLTKTQPVRNISDAAMSEIIKTNLTSSITIIRGLLKNKKINKNASIVFISSISAHYADVGNSVYSATKGALLSFSRVLALELAPQHITCNCISPGFVPSNFLKSGIISEEQLCDEKQRYPLGFGEPIDIANGIIFLLSEASRWITGINLTIDGGVTLR